MRGGVSTISEQEESKETSVNALTPMLRQYFEQKQETSGALLLFRVGDFYESYGDDAELLAQALEITLTSRDAGQRRIPMAGVPYHSLDTHLSTLLSKGLKVAISEQMEDPKQAKGLLKREIVRILTAGTVVDSQFLDSEKSYYLAALVSIGENIGVAWADVSTGEFKCTILPSLNKDRLFDEITILSPSEVLLAGDIINLGGLFEYFKMRNIPVVIHDKFQESLNLIEEINIPSPCKQAAAMIVSYLQSVLKTDTVFLKQLCFEERNRYMVLDRVTIKNLELFVPRDPVNRELFANNGKVKTGKTERAGSLLFILDETLTSMGSRMLRRWLERPLIVIDEIKERQGSVSFFYNNLILLREMRELLRSSADLERLASKAVYGSANGRDLLAIRNVLEMLPRCVDLFGEYISVLPGLIRKILDSMPLCTDLYSVLSRALTDLPPLSIRDGGMIRSGYDSNLDNLRFSADEAKQWIADMEERERVKTGIKSLKVGYNNVFGYYLEVTKANVPMVPSDYIRKQTLANGERYITEELKKYEGQVLSAEEKIRALEYQLFIEIRAQVVENAGYLRAIGEAIAQMDLLMSFALTAHQNGYICPEVDNSTTMEVCDAKHPVLAKLLGTLFVPNDIVLDTEQNRFLVITGPNMGGKSTYLRQVALLSIMSQIGSFIPAKKARIGVVDRVFTRVGASDDLYSGQSTFLVEMNETAQILKYATRRSLIILDEVGRGTSTFDGLSIAWAVAEYLHRQDRIGAKTLFATHFHELTELEAILPGVKNYRVTVNEDGEGVVFLHHIERGASDKSYGIHVAELAGFPDEVLTRARTLLNELEENEYVVVESRRLNKRHGGGNSCIGQLALFSQNR